VVFNNSPEPNFNSKGGYLYMSQALNKGTYMLFMPKEEQFFFRYFHLISAGILLAVVFLRIFASGANAEDALVFGIGLVLSMYLLGAVYGKRFAESIILDFDTRTARFCFPDKRGVLERHFQDIRKINFGFYLTFVMDDVRIMIKRPRNKKEVFQTLQDISKVDPGIFKGF
jgi:hypothetical protein